MLLLLAVCVCSRPDLAAVQVKPRPPTFAAFVSGSARFPDEAVRMVRNSLREKFEFDGVPLRLLVRYKGPGSCQGWQASQA